VADQEQWGQRKHLELAKMHAYNAWLPPPVRKLLEADPEKDKFHKVVLEIERYWKLGNAEARLASLKWISVVNKCVHSTYSV
jgi:hypothetical protein